MIPLLCRPLPLVQPQEFYHTPSVAPLQMPQAPAAKYKIPTPPSMRGRRTSLSLGSESSSDGPSCGAQCSMLMAQSASQGSVAFPERGRDGHLAVPQAEVVPEGGSSLLCVPARLMGRCVCIIYLISHDMGRCGGVCVSFIAR